MLALRNHSGCYLDYLDGEADILFLYLAHDKEGKLRTGPG
jgi:hypothetical protein